jgi:gamma-glutamylputrescine oxidase
MAGTSIWEDSYLNYCDVAIIGGGFLGQWCAYYLALHHPNLNIHIYEKDAFSLGASTRNAGFSCFGTMGELISDSEKSSFDKALELLISRYKGLKAIEHFSNTHQVPIDYEAIGGYELLKKEEFDKVSAFIEQVNQALKDSLDIDLAFEVSNLDKTELPFDGSLHVIHNQYEGGLNSFKLLQGLKEINQSFGVKTIYGLEAKEVHDGMVYLTSSMRDMEIHAKHIIIATNAASNHLTKTQQVTPGRGQVFWMQGLHLPFKGTFHYDSGYYYFRTISDNQFLIGGARNLAMKHEETLRFGANEMIEKHIVDFVHHTLHIPEFKVEKKWQGIMGFSQDKLPFIHHLTHLGEHVWHLHACNGMGVAMAPTIAKEFTEKFVF